MTDISKSCQDCRGTGTRKDADGADTVPCIICAGVGKLVVSEFDISDLEDKVNDILDKCTDILEQVTP